MIRAVAFTLLALFFHAASAQSVVVPVLSEQPCFPGVDTLTYTTATRVGITKNGGWIRMYCIPRDATQPVQVFSYVATTAELSKWGGRIQTIAKAADPLKSLQTAGTRFPILPLSDPSLAAIVADMNAATK